MKQATNPQQMELTAKVAFVKVYPVIASYVVKKYGITRGRCLDAGSGPGSLAIALAQITDLQIISLDKQSEMTAVAERNIAEAKLTNRIKTITADVCHIPFEGSYFDLIVSRGSIFFWDDRPAGLRELYRVLKPKGVLYCGGGMGNEENQRKATEIIMTDERFKDMREFWRNRSCKPQKENEIAFKKALSEAKLDGNVLIEGSGIWVEIIK